MAKSGKYSLKEQLDFEELYNRFLGLNSRERIFLVVGGTLLLLLLLIVPLSCASSKLSRQERNVINYEKNINELISKLQEYQGLTQRLSQTESQWSGASNVSLRTTLATLAAQSNLDKNVDEIKVQEQKGEKEDKLEKNIGSVRLSRVPFNDALDYLYKIENFPQASFKITKLQMKPRYDNRQLFDLSFEVSTYLLKGEGS